MKNEKSLKDTIYNAILEDIFSLEYTATDFLPIDKEELVYCLNGFSNEWVNMHDKNIYPNCKTCRVRTFSILRKIYRL